MPRGPARENTSFEGFLKNSLSFNQLERYSAIHEEENLSSSKVSIISLEREEEQQRIGFNKRTANLSRDELI